MKPIDRTEAERLVQTYSDMILRLSYTYLKSTQDAEDICQTVFLKLLTGGMVSAGYLCLFLEEPLRIVTTLLLAVIVHGLVLLISRATILYSRRRFMVTMLLSLIFAWIIEQALLRMALIPQDIRIIGHVVPGLIANDMYKQGVFKTLLGVLTSAAIVRLLVMAVVAL